MKIEAGPLDYKILWSQLRVRIKDLATENARQCAREKDIDKLRQAQGGYAFAHNLLAEMEQILSTARSGANGVIEDGDEQPTANYS